MPPGGHVNGNRLDVGLASSCYVANRRRNNVEPTSSPDVGLASSCDVASRRRNNVEPTPSPDVGLASSSDVASRRRNNVEPTSSPDVGLASSCDVASRRRHNVEPTSSPDVGLASSGDVASRRRNNVRWANIVTRGLASSGDVVSRRRNNVVTRRRRCHSNANVCRCWPNVSMFAGELWWQYRSESLRKLCVAYNNVFRFLCREPRNCSASHMFVSRGLPICMLIRKSIYIYAFMTSTKRSCNLHRLCLYRIVGRRRRRRRRTFIMANT